MIRVKVVDMEHHQVWIAVACDVSDGDGCPLILPRNPVRHFHPPRPAAGHIPTCVKLPPDAKKPLVGSRYQVLDLENHQSQTAGSEVGHRDAAALVFVRAPIRNLSPRSPRPVDVTGSIQALADPIEPT